jgi:hypothetical protein
MILSGIYATFVLALLEYGLYKWLSSVPHELGSPPLPPDPLLILFILPVVIVLGLSLLYLWISNRRRDELFSKNRNFDIFSNNAI